MHPPAPITATNAPITTAASTNPFGHLLRRWGSAEVFHHSVIRPALAAVLGGDASVADLAYHPRTSSVVNTTSFGIQPVQVGSIWYAPRVTTLSAAVNGDALDVSVRGECDLGAGILMAFRVASHSPMTLDVPTRRVTFGTDPDPDTEHVADMPWWFGLGPLLVQSITDAVTAMVVHHLPDELNSR